MNTIKCLEEGELTPVNGGSDIDPVIPGDLVTQRLREDLEYVLWLLSLQQPKPWEIGQVAN